MNDENSITSIPTTGNAVIDNVVGKFLHRFGNGFFVPRSIYPEQNALPIDMIRSASSRNYCEHCTIYGTTEGYFLIFRHKNQRENTSALPSILRDILIALDELSADHSFPRHYQDLIIQQVTSQNNKLLNDSTPKIAPLPPAEYVPYDVCETGKRVNEIFGSDVTHPDKEEQTRLREENFKLHKLVDKYAAESARLEKKMKLHHSREDRHQECSSSLRWTASPEPLFYKILSYADNDALINFSSVCKHTNQMISDGTSFVYGDNDIDRDGGAVAAAAAAPTLKTKMENPMVREMVIRCGEPGSGNRDDDGSARVPIGTKIYKFEGNRNNKTLHTGVVSSYNLEKSDHYRIVYDKIDQEDLTHNQVMFCLDRSRFLAEFCDKKIAEHLLDRNHTSFNVRPPRIVRILKEKATSDDKGKKYQQRLQMYRRVRVHNLNKHQDYYATDSELSWMLFGPKSTNKDDKDCTRIRPMNNVCMLDCSVEQKPNDDICRPYVPTLLTALAFLLPNLTEINMSGTRLGGETLRMFGEKCPLIKKIVWNHTGENNRATINADGSDMKSFLNLEDVSFDGCTFVGTRRFWLYADGGYDNDAIPLFHTRDAYEEQNYFHITGQSYDDFVEEHSKLSREVFLLHRYCKCLVRVSMRDVRFELMNLAEIDMVVQNIHILAKLRSPEFISNAIAKFVRKRALMKPVSPLSPTLRWFRSSFPIREKLAKNSSCTDLSFKLINEFW